MKSYYRILTLVFSYLLIWASCSTNKEIKKDSDRYTPIAGDLLFQDGDCGSFCEAIEKVTFGVEGARFSHVGMLVTDGDKPLVIEAVGKGVVLTSLEVFLARSLDKNGKSKVWVGRLKPSYTSLITSAIDHARTLLGKSYDGIFDINNDMYYCSELLYLSFKKANQGKDLFKLYPMTYKDPETDEIFPIWTDYFRKLNTEYPKGSQV